MGLRPYWRGFRLAGPARLRRVFLGEEGGAIQAPQEVSFSCPHRVFEGLQREAVDQVLQAVKFTDKNAPGLILALDEEFQAADCFSELIRGYTMGVVEPYIMMGLQPTGPTRVNLEVIVPSPKGLTPAMWKQTATLCPLEWPSNYSLLRLWHTPQKFPPVCCTTQAASTTSPYVHSLGCQPGEVSKQGAVPTTSPLFTRNDSATARARAYLP